MKLSRRIKNLYGKENTCVKAIITTVSIIFALLLYRFKFFNSLTTVYNYYNSDIANVSGVLAGFLFASFGLINSINSNSIVDKLNKTNNIKVVNKILLTSVILFSLVLLIYFLKQPLLLDISNLDIYSKYYLIIIWLVLILGILLFYNAFALFIFSLYILKKIICS